MRRLLMIVPLLALALAYVRCNPALSLAPPGSTMTLIANPCRIPSSGGVSQIRAILMKSTGLPVADGTVVQFFTDLGTIDSQGKTNDGIAIVNLQSDGRSGTATVTAMSGGPVSGGGANPTGNPTTNPTTSPTNAAATGGLGVLSKDASTKATTGCTTSSGNTVAVTFGAAGAGKIIMNASPTGITRGRTSLITAFVLDGDGNPVPNVAVYFSVSGSTNNSERLASGGNPVFTDNNGQAQDILSTIADPSLVSYQVTVVASTGSAATDGKQTVQINPGSSGTPTGSPTTSPTAPPARAGMGNPIRLGVATPTPTPAR